MKRNLELRKIVLRRDNYTCQKCKLEDKTGKLLEVHHIIPLVFDGINEINNLLTLCNDCHYYAPNNLEDFNEYVKEEYTGTMTILVKALNKVRDEHPEFFSQEQLKKVKNPLDNL